VSQAESRRNRPGPDILFDVANGVNGSTPVSGRLTDHVAIGVLTGLIHRDIVDDVIRESGKREKRSRLLPAPW
jgi:Insertion element 4 transposase N-terminal